eukprot:m.339810 g.339810  ORF g.339810 m.339810 type:complete len:193 (+) comp18978_c0_seq1:161-739(+)
MPASEDEETVFAVPGQRLASMDKATPGPGCYSRDGFICASLCGCVTVSRAEGKPVVEVLPQNPRLVLPEVGAKVLCRVVSITPRHAKVEIILVEEKPSSEKFRGLIRIQDIRETERDKVTIFKSFRPGDVVAAKIISLGDARSYYLSTAENHLGVVWARSEKGGVLRPVSWEEMECTKTGSKEYRKVAKPRA